ncbi:MAG: Sec-independent protein translocase TatB [Actinobacteria bacterium]|nr:Sec-independent protein translocase TatB [Actinomycetota bacterium]
MFFGLTIEKLLLIGVIAAILVGPERLPGYAESLARLTVRAREMLRGAKTRVQDEMGDGFEDVDWKKLDPRQYDPRRIIREALLDDAPTTTVKMAAAGAAASEALAAKTTFTPGDAVPFDSEAT